MEQTDRLDVDTIRAGLSARRLGKQMLVFRSTASTNDRAWEYARNPANDGLCVFAEYQTAGRGRHGSRWIAPAGESLLGSILLTGCACGSELVTLIAAVATAEAIAHCGLTDVRIKWPNDVLAGGRKVAGILVETRPTPAGDCCVVGIGINCHQKAEFFGDERFATPATSIDLELGHPVDRNILARDLLAAMEPWLSIAEQNPERVVDRWRALSSQLGRHIVVQYGHHEFRGNCIGIDPTEGLILQLDRGGVRMFPAAQSRILKQIH